MMRHQDHAHLSKRKLPYNVALRGHFDVAGQEKVAVPCADQQNAGAVVARIAGGRSRTQNPKSNAVTQPGLAGAARVHPRHRQIFAGDNPADSDIRLKRRNATGVIIISV